MTVPALLGPDEPAAAVISRAGAASPFLFLCDHAGRRIPRALGTLGLDEADLGRHIAWDIGARGTAERLAAALGATLIRQRYSRLVIDCNRAPGHETSIAARSEATEIPGNRNLTWGEIAAREQAVFHPYHALIAETLDRRQASGQRTLVVSVHSFTPVYLGVARFWDAGVLHDRDPTLGRALAALLRDERLHVGDNEPYRLTQTSDYTIPVHAERRLLPYVELEIRQDRIATPLGQAQWAARLARLLPLAAAEAGQIGLVGWPS